MNLQGRNLSIRLAGADVKLLQDELMQVGFVVLQAERDTSTFGVSTEASI
ncbi:MAG: hypothetical protein H7066_03995, partial [Cytophagaceae bacterium]|nr:hypothetical protein [Gemmatimonadaceae bacterium]